MSARPDLGDPAPPFELISHAGQSYSLQDFAGRILTLVFVRHLA
ncbi:MAG: hypothetical protein V3S20_05555 [Dehalococcoidia bacterium]